MLFISPSASSSSSSSSFSHFSFRLSFLSFALMCLNECWERPAGFMHCIIILERRTIERMSSTIRRRHSFHKDLWAFYHRTHTQNLLEWFQGHKWHANELFFNIFLFHKISWWRFRIATFNSSHHPSGRSIDSHTNVFVVVDWFIADCSIKTDYHESMVK